MEDTCKAGLERFRLSFHLLFSIIAYFPVQHNAKTNNLRGKQDELSGPLAMDSML